MSKDIKYSNKAKKQLKKGVDALANAVKVTLGPQGRTVMIERPFGDPLVTKDGVSVAKEILLTNRLQNMGAQFIKSAASKTNEKAGDGTTTATVLAQAIIAEGYKMIANGANPVSVQRGINIAKDEIIKCLAQFTKQIGDTGTELNQIAHISSNSDEAIGKMIGEAYAKVGKYGVISVEESKDTSTYVEMVEGMKFGSGYLHPYFVNDTKKGEVYLEDVYVLMIEDKITKFDGPIKKIMDLSVGQGKSLLIIGEVEGIALETFLINKTEAHVKVAIVKAPGFGERKRDLLEDIRFVLGGKIISKEKGFYMSKVTTDSFGKCASIRIDYHDTILIGGEGASEMINFRVEELQAQMKNAENDYETKQFEKRIASLKGGIGVIYVGAPSEVEMKEKRARIEDAKNATKAALEEGVVAGGGVALLQAAGIAKFPKVTGDQKVGVDIVLKAMEAPMRAIAENAGEEGSVVVNAILKKNKVDYGFDAKENKYVANMIKAGIIDPVKVTRIALENACSAAGMLLTTECTITTKMEKIPQIPQGGQPLF